MQVIDAAALLLFLLLFIKSFYFEPFKHHVSKHTFAFCIFTLFFFPSSFAVKGY